MLAFGGIGSLLGPIVGAATFTVLDEWLVSFNELRLVIYGVVIIVLFLGFQRGVVPTVQSLLARRRPDGTGEVPATDGVGQMRQAPRRFPRWARTSSATSTGSWNGPRCPSSGRWTSSACGRAATSPRPSRGGVGTFLVVSHRDRNRRLDVRDARRVHLGLRLERTSLVVRDDTPGRTDPSGRSDEPIGDVRLEHLGTHRVQGRTAGVARQGVGADGNVDRRARARSAINPDAVGSKSSGNTIGSNRNRLRRTSRVGVPRPSTGRHRPSSGRIRAAGVPTRSIDGEHVVGHAIPTEVGIVGPSRAAVATEVEGDDAELGRSSSDPQWAIHRGAEPRGVGEEQRRRCATTTS